MSKRRQGRQQGGRMPNDPLEWADQAKHEVTQQDSEPPEQSSGVAQQEVVVAKIQEDVVSEVINAVGGNSNEDIISKGVDMKAVQEMQRVLAAMRAGQLSERANLKGIEGEGADLLSGVNDLLETLAAPIEAFIAEMNNMSEEHDKGDIDVFLPVKKFKGEFADMAQGVNDMVAGHIAVKKKAMACIKEIGVGNFDAPLEQFPGKKAFINDIIETLRANLKGLIAEMDHMSAEHDKGDIDVFVPAERFKGSFATMAKGLNDMVAGHIAVKKKAMACIKEFGEGNFNATLEQFPGKKAFINDTIETLRWNLKAFNTELERLTIASQQGRLSERGQIGELKGDFAGLIRGTNTMLDAILLPIGEGNRILRQLSGGNLRERVEIECHGDHQRMKEAVNGVHSWLGELIEFVTKIANGDLTAEMSKASDQDQIYDWLVMLKNNIASISEDAATLSQAIVDGELNIEADASKYSGEYRKIIEAFEEAFVGLNNTFYQIRDTVDQVGQSADQLNSASQNMAATSEEQSSSVEEVTSSLEETDSQVKANTDNANVANQLVMNTSDAANQGQVKMDAMVGAMESINLSSQNIAKIIKVIDEIAFQTNLLALNAAVEAARAGQHGRGFAVVAQEVRNLAGRSAKAARETADLIDDSSKRVAEGVDIAGETREALNQIVTNVVKVKDLVAEIATASTEQARGVSQINIAMGQVSKAAQEGSQQAEELASSSNELTNVANQMRGELQRFKLRERRMSKGAAALAGLENLTPEMLQQLKALLLGQQPTALASRPATSPMKKTSKSPKSVIPLDHDERGFGGF